MKRVAIGGLMCLVLAFAVPTVAGAAPVSAALEPPTLTGLTAPVTGTSAAGAFAGTFTVEQFRVVDNGLTAVGQLTGTLGTQTVSQVVSFPVADATGSCQILHLVLGPLDLDLLGLQVHLDQVVLDITAQSGPGNLLGNLLCAIAGLLDDTGASPLQAIVNLLNQLLALGA
jgi:hypothetical protein